MAIKRLTGKLNKLNKEGTKWEAIVNMGYNPVEKRYERKYNTIYCNDRKAKAFLRDWIVELENEESGYSAQPLGEWLDYWLATYGKPIYNWEKNTYERALRIVNKNIKPYIGHIPLADLEPEHIVELYSTLRTIGKVLKKDKEGKVLERSPLSVRTVKYVHTILNQALNEAVDLKKIPKNPCTGKAPAPERGEPNDKWVVLNAEQLQQFLIDISYHRDFDLIHTAAYSGARESELLGLEKSGILWDASSIRIKQALHVDDESEDGFELRPRTKNRTSTRTVRLSEIAMDVLREHIAKQEDAGIISDLVFTEPDGSPISRDNLAHRYARLAEKFGYHGMTFHHLRHTHATILLANGAYINEVSKRLGHANPKITLATYGHCLPGGEEALVNHFDSLMGNAQKPRKTHRKFTAKTLSGIGIKVHYFARKAPTTEKQKTLQSIGGA